jgi:hypothetical protein
VAEVLHLFGHREGLAGEPKAFRVERLGKKSSLVREENVTAVASGSGGREDHVGIDAEESSALLGIE